MNQIRKLRSRPKMNQNNIKIHRIIYKALEILDKLDKIPKSTNKIPKNITDKTLKILEKIPKILVSEVILY